MPKIKLYGFLWYWMPTLAYCVLIFALSSSSKPFPIPSSYGADKVMHAFEYAILGLLFARSIFSMNSRSSDRHLVVLIVALATLYGISDEIHQGFVSGRMASLWDVVADGVGASIGTFCYVYVKPNF
jgi:VanZ family protein